MAIDSTGCINRMRRRWACVTSLNENIVQLASTTDLLYYRNSNYVERIHERNSEAVKTD